jgi:uncharacterized coiled-coil protein SlyX
MESAAWGLIGTVIGALASIGTTYLTNRNASHLQVEAATATRLEKHRAFQRETLLELQDAFHDAVRIVAQIQHENTMIFAKTGQWGKGKLPEGLNESLRVANRRVMLLKERVADDSVRVTTKKVMAKANAVVYAASKEESSALLDEVTFEVVDAIEKIGTTLRELY